MKIISGGQRGADIAGLRAAKSLGIETGGWINKGFKTLDGPRPEYAHLYGIKECDSWDYPARTQLNVKSSDLTIAFALNFNTRGEQCTLKYATQYKKPLYGVKLYLSRDSITCDPWQMIFGKHVIKIIEIQCEHEDKEPVINIAGNADKIIEHFVFDFVTEMLS